MKVHPFQAVGFEYGHINPRQYNEGYAGLGTMQPSQLPIVYRDAYNIRFFGLEKLHPFDSCKYGKIVARLVDAGVVDGVDRLVSPARHLTREVRQCKLDPSLKAPGFNP